MKVWLMALGEPLPCDCNPRLMRMGMLAEYLSKQGHKVTYWSSTYIHGLKKYRYSSFTRVNVNENEELLLLHSKYVYKKNVSLKRMLYHKIMAHEFLKYSYKEETPDVILCSYREAPWILAAEKYAKEKNVPLIADVRDLWPDAFLELFPKLFRSPLKVFLLPLQYQTRKALRAADAVTGIVPYSLEWAYKKTKREANPLDQSIYIGYAKPKALTEQEIQEAMDRWDLLGVNKQTWNLCFVGSLGKRDLDLVTCIRAVNILGEQYPDLRLVICGDGDGMGLYKETAGKSVHVVFPGWCGDKEIQSLFSMGNAGLYSIRNFDDTRDTFSNKLIGYMEAGLPVLSSLQGFSKTYMESNQYGIIYEEGNVDSCMEKIQWMINNQDELKKMGMKAKECFLTDFDADIVNSKFEQLLLKTVEQGRLK